MRVVIAHEWFQTWSGSEKITSELARMYPGAEVVTTVAEPALVAALLPRATPVRELWTARLPGIRSHWPYFLPAMAAAWSGARIEADVLVSVSHTAVKAAGFRLSGRHVTICCTPMRFAWRSDLEAGRMPAPVRGALRVAGPALRSWDRAAARTVDDFTAISATAAARAHAAYGREATVIYPPVDVDRLLTRARRPGDFFLAAGRLVSYKRVDLAIAACTELGLPLVVAGTGPEEERLRAMAGPTVRFTGFVSDAELDELYATARALVFCAEEDFGIVPVEAQAAGCPVIAFGQGGAAETVRDGITGVLFSGQSVDAVRDVIATFDPGAYDEGAARRWAASFSAERFRSEMGAVIEGSG